MSTAQQESRVVMEVVDDKMERTFILVSGIVRRLGGGVVVLEEWNETMGREIKKYSELAEKLLREGGLCVQPGCLILLIFGGKYLEFPLLYHIA